MKVRYKNKIGNLLPVNKGYFVIDKDGYISFPSLLFICNDDKYNLCIYPIIVAPTDNENPSVLEYDDNIELLQKATIPDIEKYCKRIICDNKIKTSRCDEEYICKEVFNIIKEMEYRDIYISEFLREYIRDKKFLNLLKQNSNE